MLGGRELQEGGIDHDSGTWIASWIAIMLVVFTMIFDVGSHKITGYLTGAREEEEEHTSSRKKMVLCVWQRFQSELTTLGFLAFVVWIFSSAGFFEAVTLAAKQLWKEGAEAEGATAEERRLEETSTDASSDEAAARRCARYFMKECASVAAPSPLVLLLRCRARSDTLLTIDAPSCACADAPNSMCCS